MRWLLLAALVAVPAVAEDECAELARDVCRGSKRVEQCEAEQAQFCRDLGIDRYRRDMAQR